MKKFFIRIFTIISIEKAYEYNLTFVTNVYGDEINIINCRSLWIDGNGRYYRIKQLNNG